MKHTVTTIFAKLNVFSLRRFCALCVLCTLPGLAAWAGGKKDQVETAAAEGGEIWEHNFNIEEREKGVYNYIVNARDRAGNEAVSGAFDVSIDPDAGPPVARIVYPENNSIVRQSIDVFGVATGRYGIAKVMLRLDDGDYADVTGIEYWNKAIDFSVIPDGLHRLYVQAFDPKGAPGPEQSISFILDKTPPQIELSSHQIGDIIAGTATIRGTASDPNGIGSMEYSLDGLTFNSLKGKRSGQGRTAFEFALPVKTQKMPDGPLVCYLRATDTTGANIVKPWLFFVTNSGPELEVYTPVRDENVYNTFFLSGRAYDKVGLSRLYYEWGKETGDIVLRAGDPYWNLTLDAAANPAASIKVSAVDKAGNVNSVTCKLEDRRKVKVPVLVIDYPPPETLKAMQKSMPADTAIYGHLSPESEPLSVIIEGQGEVQAQSAFRIDPAMIPSGPKAQTLRLTPTASGTVNGAPLSLRYTKPESFDKPVSGVTVSSPLPYRWVSGQSFTLEGNVTDSSDTVEFRLGPDKDWRPLSLDEAGAFSAEIDISALSHGPVHLELRTLSYGQDNYPYYNPFNRAVAVPEIQIVSLPAGRTLMYGNKTVMGTVDYVVPLAGIQYSLDGETFTDLPFSSRYGKAWFSYFCDFSALGNSGAQLMFRVIDVSGTQYDHYPEYQIEANPPVPTIVVNTPVDNEVVSGPFDISGLAYDNVGIKAVYWRILGPSMESITIGAAGQEAREVAAAFAEDPDPPFRELYTDQTFQIPVDFSMVTDGEYIIEIYASDPYGVHSETVSRTVKVSTAAPKTEILEPVITRYNQKAIMVKGYTADANGVASVALSMDNGNTWQNVILYTDGNWETSLNTVLFTDSIYSALVRSIDKYDVTTFSNAMINIDNTPPELYLSSPLDGQHTGTELRLAGRVSDNITMKSMTVQLISAEDPSRQMLVELPPDLVIFQSIDLSEFPEGEYIVRMVATDLADNETLVSRKIMYDPDDTAAVIAIFNPLPGEVYTGPVYIAGTISGSFQPEKVRLKKNDQELAVVTVDRFGVFHYEIPEELMSGEEVFKVSAYYLSSSGATISSPEHTVHYSPYGPVLLIESHHDGDVVTGRPWLEGRAWIAFPDPAEDDPPLSRREKSRLNAQQKVRQVTISHDNGRTFNEAEGGGEWKFRLETSELELGPHPVVVRAEFADGTAAIRRVLFNVDTTAPQVETLAPAEGSTHRDNLMVYGTAADNYGLAGVDITLRPGSKLFYSVPGPLQGLYLDIKGMGATYFDVGLGFSFFDDNVRLQAQFGIAPVDGINTLFSSGGRFTGNVFGIKLLANILYLPFDYLFGLDWAFYSMNFAVGANFSYFTMDEWREPVYMGAVVGQWDIANIDMSFFNPRWRYFNNFAVYLEPELWFVSSDVQAGTILRMTFGMRLNFF